MRLAIVLALVACGRDRDNSLAELIAPAIEQTPGLQIVVEHRGAIVLDRSFGFADLENEVPVGPDTVFAIGSLY